MSEEIRKSVFYSEERRIESFQNPRFSERSTAKAVKHSIAFAVQSLRTWKMLNLCNGKLQEYRYAMKASDMKIRTFFNRLVRPVILRNRL